MWIYLGWLVVCIFSFELTILSKNRHLLLQRQIGWGSSQSDIGRSRHAADDGKDPREKRNRGMRAQTLEYPIGSGNFWYKQTNWQDPYLSIVHIMYISPCTLRQDCASPVIAKLPILCSWETWGGHAANRWISGDQSITKSVLPTLALGFPPSKHTYKP